jgi:hypothetical protein
MTNAAPVAVVHRNEHHEFLFSCEKLAYWFFRLNGCLFLENFLIHHEIRGREGTEVDMLSVRFPYRQELLLSGNAMPDHPIFNSDGQIDIIFAESKKGLCSINESWLDPEKHNMERILYAVGALPPDNVDDVSKILYKENYYNSSQYRIRLFAIGENRNSELSNSILQLEWPEVLFFIRDRFLFYWRHKTQHRQWDSVGQRLFAMTHEFRDKPEEFVSRVMSKLVD